jgi:hypothetical protein
LHWSPTADSHHGTHRRDASLEPSHVGVQAALQVALFATAGPLGIDLSNGLIATIGY